MQIDRIRFKLQLILIAETHISQIFVDCQPNSKQWQGECVYEQGSFFRIEFLITKPRCRIDTSQKRNDGLHGELLTKMDSHSIEHCDFRGHDETWFLLHSPFSDKVNRRITSHRMTWLKDTSVIH